MIYEVSKKKRKKDENKENKEKEHEAPAKHATQFAFIGGDNQARTPHKVVLVRFGGLFGPSPGIRESCLGNNALRGR